MNQTREVGRLTVGEMGMTRVFDEVVGRGAELHRLNLKAFNRFPN
jgi:hypothetical protein